MSDPNPEFKAYGSARMQWIEDWREEFDDATDAHDATTRRRMIDHTGWYLDNSQHETTCGVVLRIATECTGCGGAGFVGEDNDTCADCDGEGRTFTYAAAVKDPYNTHSVLVDREQVYDDIDECARQADCLTERFAEDAREDDAKFQAEQQLESAIEAIASARKEHSKLIGAVLKFRDGSYDNAACTAQRAGLRSEVAAQARRIKKLRAEPWTAVE